MIYSEKRFEAWSKRALKSYQTKNPKTKQPSRKYLKKGYLHFDRRIWLPDHLDSIRSLVSNPDRVAKNPYYPFVRWVMKTPRYKKVKDKEGNEIRKLTLKERPIAFASHRDSLIYAFYAHALTEEYEHYIKAQGFAESVLAYRSDLGLSNVDFAREVFRHIQERGPCSAIALDVTGFFDNLDHGILKDHWCQMIGEDQLPADQYKMFRSLTKYSYVNRSTVLRTLELELRGRKRSVKRLDRICEDSQLQILRDRNVIVTNQTVHRVRKRPIGIPQGSPISATLSNIYMIAYDALLFKLSKEYNFLYRRYCDDILIVCDAKDKDDLLKLACDEITTLGLDINQGKAEVVTFKMNHKKELRGYDARLLDADIEKHRNLQYLGFEFDGWRTYIRSASMAKFYRRMMARVGEVAKAAVGKNAKGLRPWTRKIYERYTVHGSRNFPVYAFNAASAEYQLAGKKRQGMNSPQIRKQMSKHVSHMQKALAEKLELRELKKAKREAAKAKTEKA
jgi:RNA-directed DNA polymerase